MSNGDWISVESNHARLLSLVLAATVPTARWFSLTSARIELALARNEKREFETSVVHHSTRVSKPWGTYVTILAVDERMSTADNRNDNAKTTYCCP